MTRYQLAKLVQWAGTLRARKRLQKVVFILQEAGCPFEAEYTLHHYGPYSQEVATISDEMVELKLLDEGSDENQVGKQYSYRLSDSANESLSEFEKTAEGQKKAAQLASFEDLAKELLQTELWELELASTILYFKSQDHDWESAVERACKFKNVVAATPALKKAEALARRTVA